METKRCVYCHKLQRADAHACSRCGHVFVQKRSGASSRREWTQPSIPPASPHRAGHYSGLHPEDQPYQSNKIAVQRPMPQDNEGWRASFPEPEHIVLPVTDPGIRNQEKMREYCDERSAEELAAIEDALFNERRRGLLPRRVIPVLLAISCIFFLLASSILVVVLIRKSTSTFTPRITASPSIVHVNDTLTLHGSGFSAHSLVAFTYDMNKTIFIDNKRPLESQTSEHGTFSVQLRIPSDWGSGPHLIHATDNSANVSVSTTFTIQQVPVISPILLLSTSNLDFGMDAPGVVSDKVILLTNSGGGRVAWRMSSDQAWLTVSPGNNVFSGHESVHVTVNRSALAPNSYTGHITFMLENGGSTSSLTLTVTMGVAALSSVLAVSPPTLSFAMVVGQQPVLKAVILQNSSNQVLNWSTRVSTTDQGHWLSVDLSSGTLSAGVESFTNARVDVQGLQPGSYQGTLTLLAGDGTMSSVKILLTVSS